MRDGHPRPGKRNGANLSDRRPCHVDTVETKYTRTEYERKFLVSAEADWKRRVEPYSKTFEDNYLRHGRLRLRVLTDSDTGRRVLKLTKKYESPSPYFRKITTLLLSDGEYRLFDALEGDRLRKVRHYHSHHGRIFSIDEFDGRLEGLVLCETEAEGLGELMSVEPPSFAQQDVTEDPFFTGGNLSRASRDDLLHKLAMFE
jgi:CYTH domain-containing protein